MNNNQLKNENKTFKFIVKPNYKLNEGYCFGGCRTNDQCGNACQTQCYSNRR